jgi:hypothetical protein
MKKYLKKFYKKFFAVTGTSYFKFKKFPRKKIPYIGSSFLNQKNFQEKFRTQHHGPWSAQKWGYGGRGVTPGYTSREGYAGLSPALSILYPYTTNVA